MKIEERLAVLENEVKHTNHDIDEFFEFVRKHMEREEVDRLEMIEILQKLRMKIARQTYFVSGIMCAIAAIWSIAKVFM